MTQFHYTIEATWFQDIQEFANLFGDAELQDLFSWNYNLYANL